MDVNSLCADLLSISAHKLYGPKGVGALYVRKGVRLSPMMTGGHHEGTLRAGTENVAGIVGFAHALKIAIDEMDIYSAKVSALRDQFESALLEQIPFSTIHSTQAERLPHCSAVGFNSVEAESILLHLDLKGIAASSGSACTTGESEPSHVLTAMGIHRKLHREQLEYLLARKTRKKKLITPLTFWNIQLAV